ncbi:MAG: T9SS type A sorting domain-containing protein [Bacteroidales bacterium]|nr:T9SS type A sorting domain-containing protein [Bacteroidales bacterium]
MKKLIMIVTALMLSGMMFAQEYHWTAPNSSLYDYRNHITAQVKIDGVLQASDAIEIAAFIGDEVRGVIRLLEPYPVGLPGQYYTYLTVFANQPEIGQTITLKAYDHDTGTEYDNCQQTFEFSGAEEYHYGGIEIGLYLEFVSEQILPFGPDYPWIQSSNYSGNGMTLTAQIQIDGELVDRATWEVGAFCDNECRGDKTPLTDWTDLNMGYFVDMNILGNNGDIIDFYLYDTEAGSVLRAKCFTTVELVNDTYIGQDVFNDLFVLNFVTEQTFTKEIAAYTENGGYYLIASPIGEVDPENVTNMLENSFDLYYFNQSSDLEWINYKGTDGNYNLLPGKGYLYANSDNVTLTFTGFPYGGDGEVSLTYDASANFPGWNLVGNPFTDTAYIDREFYVMNNIGTEIIAGEGNSVAAMEGIFVVAETDGETMTFSTEEPNRGASLTMNITQNRGAAIDRAIIRFGEESTLPKFMLNENNTKVYIPQDNKDYAVVSVNSDMGEMPVNFKAAKNGTYTLSFSNEEVSFSYLHLIDNLTGVDVDLLETPSYSFDAKATDYATRFKLVFATGNATDDSFVFFSNGNWVINNDGKAIAQVVDVTGRILKSEKIEGCHSMSINATPGVYMIRLISGNDVKVQKVVVK